MSAFTRVSEQARSIRTSKRYILRVAPPFSFVLLHRTPGVAGHVRFPQTPGAAVRSRAAGAIIGHWRPSISQERGMWRPRHGQQPPRAAKTRAGLHGVQSSNSPAPFIHAMAPLLAHQGKSFVCVRPRPILPRGSIPSGGCLPAGTHEDVPFLSICVLGVVMSTIPGPAWDISITELLSSPCSCFVAFPFVECCRQVVQSLPAQNSTSNTLGCKCRGAHII